MEAALYRSQTTIAYKADAWGSVSYSERTSPFAEGHIAKVEKGLWDILHRPEM